MRVKPSSRLRKMFSATLISTTQPTAWRSSGTTPMPAAVISFGLQVRGLGVAEKDPAFGRRQHAGQHRGEFALPVAFDAGDADDLAAARSPSVKWSSRVTP